jgi:hypothetical protein
MDVPLMQRVPDARYEFGPLGKPFHISEMIAPQNGAVS